MSFFDKIKKGLGVGTITFELEVPARVAPDAGQLSGSILLTAKSEQLVKDVEVVFEQVFEWDERQSRRNSSTGQQETHWVDRRETVELGTFTDTTEFTMESGETRTIPFVIEFARVAAAETAATGPEGLAWDLLDIALSPDSSGFFGPSMRNQRISYRVRGDVNLDGVVFDKGDDKRVIVE